VNRRAFITLLGGAATGWPFAAHGQGSDRVRRVGVMIPEPENYQESQARLAAFREALTKLGWTPGRNLVIDYHWEVSNLERARAAAAELLALAPDVILPLPRRLPSRLRPRLPPSRLCLWRWPSQSRKASLQVWRIPAAI
jgi:hypothetical protein